MTETDTVFLVGEGVVYSIMVLYDAQELSCNAWVSWVRFQACAQFSIHALELQHERILLDRYMITRLVVIM